LRPNLSSLTEALTQTYHTNPENISMKVEADNVLLDLDIAIPCGLIVNELVSNSLKYAFPDGKRGHISVSCKLGQERQYLLVVGDDGVGLPDGMDPMKTHSLGLKLVTSLVKQVGGQMEIHNSHGTRFEIRFSQNAE
jgi:two-component sensor histidine kinase